ncbi:MAG: CsbD family protein [Ilumatobacteraceae bacterium]
MGTKDKVSNMSQDVKGKVKETVGKAVGNQKLERKGKSDQAKSAVKDVGEKAKDATSKVKRAVTGH